MISTPTFIKISLLLCIILLSAVSSGQIVINEIHYHPKDSIYFNIGMNAFDTISGRNFEFVEFKNVSSNTICLDGSFLKGDTTDFTIAICIPPNGFAVLAEDASWFNIKYGFAPDGQYAGSLSDDGETLTLLNSSGTVIESMTYNDSEPWDIDPDDGRNSLELLNPAFDNNNYINWFRSDNFWGTPRAENSRVCTSTALPMVINELNYNSNNLVFDPGDWLELYNPSPSPVNLSGWSIYDQSKEYVIPAGTMIPAEGYFVFVEDLAAFGNEFPQVSSSVTHGPLGYSLANNGERISIFDQNKCLSDHLIYSDNPPWPLSPDGTGQTLALEDPALENLVATNWSGSFDIWTDVFYGSPGRANYPNCPADIVPDGIIDINDFIAFNSAFGSSCSGCAADINGNGVVEITDFLALNSAFGQPCD